MDPRSVVDEVLRARIEAEYREMPGLSLTAAQAKRLWGLDSECCAQVLSELINSGFLRYRADGRYCRNTGEDSCHWHRRDERAEDDALHAGHADGSCSAAAVVSDHQRSGRFSDAREALAAILGAAARVDGSVLPCESERLEHTLSALPMFRGQSEQARHAMIERALSEPAGDDESLMHDATAALPSELRGTAFAIGIDVLLADGRLHASERRFVEQMRRLLHVRRSFARQVLGVLGTKNLVWTEARLQA